MSQINVNTPERVVESVDSGDRTAAAGINLVTVLIVLGVLAVIAWFLFTGPLGSFGSTTTDGTTNVTVNQPPTTINVNPPSQPNAPAPGGSSNSGSEPAPGRQP